MNENSLLHPEPSPVLQPYGHLTEIRIGLAADVRMRSVLGLNRLLAHTIALRDLYKKSHWQTSGAAFYELHLLFDKHYGEQEVVMDAIAERIQTLGGVVTALASDVAHESRLSRGPSGVENAQDQLRRLVDSHEFMLEEARPIGREAGAAGDDGTNDLVISQIVRGNEQQSWFVSRHLTSQDLSEST